MAEAIGLAASLISCLQVAGTAIKLADFIIHTAQEAGNIEETMQIFSLQIRSFAAAVGTAHSFLCSYKSKNVTSRSDSAVWSYIQKHRVIQVLSEEGRLVKRYARQLRKQVALLKSR